MAGDLGTLKAALTLDTTRFEKSMNTAENRMQSAGKSMQRTGKQMSQNISLPLVAAGGIATKVFSDFEASMNQVAAVSQATGSQMQELEGIARELGSTTKFSASEAAEGMNFLAMAGFEVDEMASALPSTLNLAAAGNMQLGESADIVSNIMQGFSKDASQTGEVVDILTKAFTSSNTSLGQLGEAMSYAAPVANAFGQSIEDTTAAVGVLSDAGIQASKAGTGLRQTFMQLQKNSDKLGISVTDAQGNMLPLVDMLEQIEKSGMKTTKVIDIVGSRAGTALAAMLERGSDSLRNFSGELKNAGGTADQVAKKQMEGIQGAFTELQSALSELAIAFTDPLADSIESMIDSIKGVVQWLSDLDEGTKKIITTIAGIAAAIGPVLVVLGTFSKGIGKIIGVAGTAIKTLQALWAVMMANPITAIVGAVAVVTTAIVALSNKTSVAVQVQNQLNDAAKQATEGLRSEKAELQVMESQLDQVNSRLNEQKAALAQAEKGSADYQIVSENLKNTQEERKDIIDKLNKNYGKYLDSEIKMSNTYGEIKNKLEGVNAQLQKRIKLKALEAKREEAYEQAKKVQEEIAELKRKQSTMTEENAKEELSFLQKLKSGYMSVAELHFDFKKEQLEDAKEYNDEEISENQKKYQEFLKQYNHFDQELQKRMDEMDIGKGEEDAKEEGKRDGKAYADGVEEGAKQNPPQLPKETIKMPDIDDSIDLSSMNEALNEMRGQMRLAENRAFAFGDSVNLLEEQQRILKSTITSLLSEGYDPTHRKIQGLINQYEKLKQKTDQASESSKKFKGEQHKISNSLSMVADSLGRASADIVSNMGQMAAGVQNAEQKMVSSVLDASQQIITQKFAEAMAKMIAGESSKGLLGLATATAGIAALQAMWSKHVGQGMGGGGESSQNSVRGLPKMAEGGQVPSGYPNDTYPAMLSSREVVAPPEKLPNLNEDKQERLVANVKGDQLQFILDRNKKKNKRLKD